MARYIDADKLKQLRDDVISGKIVVETESDLIDMCPTADVAEVKHGEWKLYADNEDGYDHHRCSVCKGDAIFTYIDEADYDEGCDGEWHYICDRTVGIEETLSNYCPNCGAKMDGTT